MLTGQVHGGAQPVVGATIQLYAVSTTGDGTPATPLISTKVVTNAQGDFSITGDYVCPASTSPVYLTATGGDPGLAAGTNNTALALMAALGECGSLSASTYITVNEVTTVASIWPLAPFANAYAQIGSSTADAQELGAAFDQVQELDNTSTGAMPGPLLPPGYASPIATINTLADILGACVNSTGGVAGDGSGASVQTITLADRTGYWLTRQVYNSGNSTALLVTQSEQLLAGNTAVLPGTTALLTPVPGSLSTGGCSWERTS